VKVDYDTFLTILL